MFNKKFGLLVMSAAMMGLASCGGNNPAPNPSTAASTAAGTSTPADTSTPAATTGGGSAVTVPTQEGKITVYFEYEDNATDSRIAESPVTCLTLKEVTDCAWVAPFVTGNWNTYGVTPAEGAYEMTLLENTNIFYAFIPADSDLGDLGYQITLGYNAASGVSAGKQGINWSYKACANDDISYPYPGHPTMNKIADNVYQCVGAENAPYAFTQLLPEPVMVKNPMIKFKMELTGELTLGENLEYCLKGSFNNWTAISLPAPDEEGYYQISLGDEVINGKFEFCFGVRNKLVGEMNDMYNFYRPGKGKGKGATYTEKKEGDTIVETEISNFSLTVLSTQKPDTVADIGTFTNPAKMTITKTDAEGKVVKEVVDYALPMDDVTMDKDVVITVNNSGTALGSDVAVSICGSFNSWGTHVAMIVAEAGKSWTYTLKKEEIYATALVEFKVTDGDWRSQLGGKDGANLGFRLEKGKGTVTITADMTGFGVQKEDKSYPSIAGTLVYGE